MNTKELSSIIDGIAPVFKKYVADSAAPLSERIAELDRKLAASPVHHDTVLLMVRDAVAGQAALLPNADAVRQEVSKSVSAVFEEISKRFETEPACV